jgi:RNA ligase (TIGR02306 family)
MENNNSVCYVARINEIKPIPGADNIEQVVVGGWQAITKKGDYQVDDLVIVATTDAVIPQELSDAMNVTNYLRKGQRVRTVKLRGMYSECLIIPFVYAEKLTHPKAKWAEGTDMMDLFKIYKYEPPVREVVVSGGRKVKYKDNPLFYVYHKFPNLKNVAGLFTEEDEVEISRKIHGTNARYGVVKKKKISLWDRVRKFFGNRMG